MLSYRHSFHAGNFADLLKHIVQVEILEHLIQKDKPFEYIDTHSGAGIYNLKSANAQKLQEYSNGIAKIQRKEFPELARYLKVVRSYNQSDTLLFYPGSPAITQYFLRPQDRAWLFELHPKEYELLSKNIAGNKNVRVQRKDGFDGLNSLLPPTAKRGLILIDPSYEVKSDYDVLVKNLVSAHRKFSHGTYAIWYPVIDRKVIDRMERSIVRSGIKNIQRFELGVSADSDERGMTASGMIVINPPWKLFDKMSALLPKLAQKLSEDGSKHFKCDVLAAE